MYSFQIYTNIIFFLILN